MFDRVDVHLSCYDDAEDVEKELSEKIFVSYSGGKDSTAMLLMMLEKGERIDGIYFANTTLEYPEMYAYIRKINDYIKEKYDKEIITINPKSSFYTWFYGTWTRGKLKGERRGFPKMYLHGYCCRELKINPLNRIRGMKGIFCLGYAYDEKNRIQKAKNLRYPLIEYKMTEADCRKYLEDRDLLNPLYLRFKRTGCWLCPRQPLGSLKILYRDYPILWKQLKKLEKESPHGFRPDYTLDELEVKFQQNL